MLDVLRFVFSSFWVWLGTFLIVATARGGPLVLLWSRMPKKKPATQETKL